MKPLLDRKVQRGQVVNEWTSAAHHATHDGSVEFHARMQARIRAADAARKAASNVQPIKGKKA